MPPRPVDSDCFGDSEQHYPIEKEETEACVPNREMKYYDERQASVNKSGETKDNVSRNDSGYHELEVCYGSESDLHQHLLICRKNPGHTQFIPIKPFKIEHLPSGYRGNLVLDYIRAEADLTCRLSVKYMGYPEVEVSYGEEPDLLHFYRSCNKNPGRTNFIPVRDFNIELLPPGYRDNVTLAHIKAETDLTHVLVHLIGKECSFKETLTKQIPKQWNGAEHLNSLLNESPAFEQSYGNEFLIKNTKNTGRSELLQQRLFCLILKRVTDCLLHNISQLSYLIHIRCPDLWDIFINRWYFQILRGGCQEEWEVFFLLIKSPDRLLVWGSSVTGPNIQSEYIKMFTNTNDISNHYINRKCMPRDQIVLQARNMHGVEDKASAQESDANTENVQAFEKQCMNKEEHVADVDSRKGTVEECHTDEPSNEEESQYGITGCHETVNSNTSDLQADAINPDTPDQMQNGKADSHDGDLQRDFEGSVKEDEADNNCYSSQDDVALIESEAPDVATEEENVSKGSAVLEEVTAKVSDSTKKLKLSDESFGTTLPESGKNEQTDVDSGRGFTSKGDPIKLGKQEESIRAVVSNDFVNRHSSRRRPNYLPHDEVEMVKSRVKAISRFLGEEGDLGQPQLSDNIRFSSLMKLSADSSLPESWYKDMCSLRRSFTQQDLMMYPLERFGTNFTPRKHPAEILGIPWDEFERETMRLASFSRYPIDANKSSSLLAESGFVYIGDGTNDKVICFYCHLTKENWRSHEDIGDVHKTGSPHCPMVINLTSNNSATTTEASAASSARAVTYSSATGPTRGGGFSSLPSSYASAGVEDEVDIPPRGHRPPTSMPHVQAGQQSIGNTSSATPYTIHGASDTARHQPQAGGASSRRGTQQQQPSSQQAISNHQDERQEDSQQNRAHHPNINSQIYSIPRNPDTSNDTSTTTTPSQSAQVVNGNSSTTGSSEQPRSLNYRDLGILCERPKHPELAVIVNRVMTYDGWPQEHHLKPDDLAKAGFHYAGYADCCKCFFCGGGLRKWDKEDDPYVEHARWFPKCGYIRQLLGDDFIVAVQELKGQALETIPMQMVKDLMKARGMDLKNQFDDGKVEDDAAVKSLIDEGYDKDLVYRVATDLKNNGVALSADVILEKINATTQPTSAVAGVDVADSAEAGTGRSNAEDEDIQELKDQNYTLRNNLICKICMDKEVRMVFLPCGHLVSCQECAVALQDCPVCRKHIRATVRASIR